MTMPPLRPGHIYYVGVRALRDSVLSIGATTNGLVGRQVETIPFYGGSVQLTLPALSEVLYRIDVPLDATRWKHWATHQNGVVLYIEQGTVPTKSASDDYRSTAANWNLNIPLVVWNTALRQYDPAPWPAVAGHSFYLLITHTSNMPQDFTFLMDGCSYVTEDEDRDQLPDIWERFYFSGLSQSETTDFDRDGVRNLEEQADGTDPTNPFDFYCRLTVTPINGVVYADQVRERYQIGQEVVLTPVAYEGYTFVSWGGDASGCANPLRIVMDGAKTISALFKLTGDNFDTPLWIKGEQTTINAMNVSMTKEPGEPFHSGNPGGKSIWWRWVAPRSGAVTLSTAGSWFNTLLAVYTGTNVAQLTLVANDFTSGTNSSRVTFQATAGDTYNIAVDGYDAASSFIQLSLAVEGGGTVLPDLRLGVPVRVVGGALQMGLSGPVTRACTIYYSTNLNQWHFLQNVTTDANGAATITDPAQNVGPVRFYRAQLQ
jgi:hypothetical protein